MTRAIVLTGEGAAGAYQGGVLSGLKVDDFHAAYGTSSGALNATLFAFRGDPEAEWMAMRGLRDAFAFNWLAALWRPALFNNGPILKKIERIALWKKPAIPVCVTITDLQKGTAHYSRCYHPATKRWCEDAAASATIPGLACPVRTGRSLAVDGGAKDNLPIRRALLDGHDDITVVLARPWDKDEQTWRPSFPPPFRWVDSIGGAMSLIIESLVWWEIQAALEDPRLKSLTVYAPSHQILMNMIDFKPAMMQAAFRKGVETKPVKVK